ncbi:MAG: hypothetical protein MJB57_18045 [Gemmatimonadetes bacterium]|nr:hypothetical protein [Gemmatimonadota bacterium]
MAVLGNWMAEVRNLEAAGDVQAAIAIYRNALVRREETAGFTDLSLYNGLGDLYLRAGCVEEALEVYEGAAQHCEDQQLYANGIALCKKILRNAPDYAPAYRRAARLSALSGLEAEARLHYSEYRERVTEDGHEAEALDALREIVEITADEESSVELAEELVEHGDRDAAIELLRSVKARRQDEGRAIVILVRTIQELQRDPNGDDEIADFDEFDIPTESDPPSIVGEVSPTDGRAAGDLPEADEVATRLDELDAEVAAGPGTDGHREALRRVEEMLERRPGRVDLLLRKLQYAVAVGDEPAAVSAYLALGEGLDRTFHGFTVRTLSSSAEHGTVTAAIQVEELPAVPGS